VNPIEGNAPNSKAEQSPRLRSLHPVRPSHRSVGHLGTVHLPIHRESMIRPTANTSIATRRRSRVASLTTIQETHHRKVLGQHTTQNISTTIPSQHLQEYSRDHLPEHNTQTKHPPAKLTTNPNASGKIGLHDQESHRGPEDDFEGVQDPIGLVALPAVEGSDVLGGDLVGDEDEGFGALLLV
jgi:hypothetical protein